MLRPRLICFSCYLFKLDYRSQVRITTRYFGKSGTITLPDPNIGYDQFVYTFDNILFVKRPTLSKILVSAAFQAFNE